MRISDWSSDVCSSDLLAMIARLAGRLPSQTRRSEESQQLQQFSTPITLGAVAARAARIGPGDLVLEPSAGTGLLAVFAQMAGAALALNETAETRAGLLARLFRGAGHAAQRRADPRPPSRRTAPDPPANQPTSLCPPPGRGAP